MAATKFETADKSIIVSEDKITKTTESRGMKSYHSINLAKIDSILVQYRSKPSLIVAAAISLIGSASAKFYIESNYIAESALGVLIFGIILSAALVAMYVLSRRSAIVINSANSTMTIPSRGEKMQSQLEFVHKLEQACYEAQSNMVKI